MQYAIVSASAVNQGRPCEVLDDVDLFTTTVMLQSALPNLFEGKAK